MFQFPNGKETIYKFVTGGGLQSCAYHADDVEGGGIYVLLHVPDASGYFGTNMLGSTTDEHGWYDTGNSDLKMTPSSRSKYPDKDSYNIIQGTSATEYTITMTSGTTLTNEFPTDGSPVYSVWRVFASAYCNSDILSTNTVSLFQNLVQYDSLVVDAGLVGESRVYYARKQITDTDYWTILMNSESGTIVEDGVTYQIADNASNYNQPIVSINFNKYDSSSNPSIVDFSNESVNHFLILKLTINDYSVEQASLFGTDSSDSSDSSMEFLASSTVELDLTSSDFLELSVVSADLNTVLSGLTDTAAIVEALEATKTAMKDTVTTELAGIVGELFGLTPSSTKLASWVQDTLLPTLFTEAQMEDIKTQLTANGRYNNSTNSGFALNDGDKIGVTVRIKQSETNYSEVNIYLQQAV
jgi:hypothetical protein